MTVDPDGPKCFCGNRGCLGMLAGGKGLVKRFRSTLYDSNDGLGKNNFANGKITPEKIYLAAEGGNEYALKTIEETGRLLGIGTANLLSSFNPEMVIFTGGLTRMGERLLKVIREEAYGRVYPAIGENAAIEFGQLGDSAGVIGAGMLLLAKKVAKLRSLIK